jgi:hypothetical protein
LCFKAGIMNFFYYFRRGYSHVVVFSEGL